MQGAGIALVLTLGSGSAVPMEVPPQPPVQPFQPDEQTLLLYHFGKGQGTMVRDSSGRGYDGEVRGGQWVADRFGKALRFDGFFFDGVVKQRLEAARDFRLGAPSRGLWVGCYLGTDFWYCGLIDEMQVSGRVRYDPERQLKVGERVFEMPGTPTQTGTGRAVRKLQRAGIAKLQLTFKKLYGGPAAGWVYLKPPGRPAVIVGEYQLPDQGNREEIPLAWDVSDEVAGTGSYIVGLEATESAGYFAVTEAVLISRGREIARWSGQAVSRRTFNPPLLVPLRVQKAGGKVRPPAVPYILLLPQEADRMGGHLEIAKEDAESPPCLIGEGYAEWWLDLPAAASYRVYLRYATPNRRPCDLVIDGQDLNDFNMCALNRTGGSGPREAFWEYQGTTTLPAGVHWLRLQDVLPDVVALRLVALPSHVRGRQRTVPWQRYRVPSEDFPAQADSWTAQMLFGSPQGAFMERVQQGNEPALRFFTWFGNTDRNDLFGGDGVRLVHRGAWDLEPFGRLSFRFEGQGSEHVVALRLVDAKGDEKLLWRVRDTVPGSQEMAVPISFEGNDVFDLGHVVAICFDLDEGNVRSDQVNDFAGTFIHPRFERRDVIVLPAGYPAAWAVARQSLVRFTTGHSPFPTFDWRSPGFRPWTRPVIPEEHPLYASTEPKPVTRQTLGYELHSTGARGIAPPTLEDFHTFYNFGQVCWPHIGICPQRHQFPSEEDYRQALQEFERLLQGVRERGLYLFDIWGYVPFDPNFPHRIAPEHHEILLRVFGDRFLGYDNGEQDGRYIGSYADRGPHTNRREGWEDFVRWDEQICRDNGNYMNATGSLNFSHYYGERNARMLGLETAQGLPSDTLMFAFLRGASKQYGRLTYQATSVWNRFGYNLYHDRKTEGPEGYGYGPHKGCSLSLHKRLFFSSYLGGDSIVGTETGQFTADRLENGAPELSPLGRQHLDIMAWVKQHPDRGVMYTPVAFILDFYNGWNMPRHLYRSDKYKVWGKLPYEKGDYLIDQIFRMVWPGYEDCSYLRNERGFITPTPYGDLFDVLTNRCHPEVLKQYTSLMLLGEVEMAPTAVQNLTEFVRAGGDLILDAVQAAALPASLTGVRFGGLARGTLSHLLATNETFEELPYTYTVLTPTSAIPLLVNEAGHPLLTLHPAGAGRVIIGAVDCWMTDALRYASPEIVNMEPPYRLLRGLQAALDRYFDSFSPVEIEPKGLNLRICCYDGDPQRLLVGLLNNELFADWEGTLRVRGRSVASAKELWRGRSLGRGRRIKLKIPAGDVAILDLRLSSGGSPPSS